MARIAINGFGRIGRTFLRMAFGHPDIEIVAINDLGGLDNLAYILQYDSVYGRSPFSVKATEDKLKVDNHEIVFLQERDPEKLPWKDLVVDVVVEATGFFAPYEGAKKHLTAGAKRVVVSAPVKDDPEKAGIKGATVLMGVNDDLLETCVVTSNGSCTTNATSPLVAILKESIGIEKALLNIAHAYTATQSLVDGPSKGDVRKGRSAAINIIPSATGAAISTTKVHQELDGKFDGIALRVPVPVGSIVDVTFVASRNTTAEEVNDILRVAAKDKRWENIFSATDEPIVSSDIIGSRVGSLADLSCTRVADGNLVKVLAWYDNETSYTNTLVKHVIKIGQNIK